MAATVDPLVTNTVEPLVGGTVEPLVTNTVEPLVSGTVDPLVTNTVEPLVADTAGPLASAVDPLVGAVDRVGVAGPLTGSVEPVADVVGGVGESAAGPLEHIAAVEPVNETAQPLTGMLEPPPATGEGDGEPFWTFPFEALTSAPVGSEELLILSALAAAGATAIKVRFFLANTPPIPAACFVGDLSRYISASRFMPALRSGTTGLNSGVRMATAAVENTVGKAESTVEEFGQTVRDGFLRGAGFLDKPDDEASDTRLLMQIGMVLGTVYLAFLTIWFWATRLRWSPRT